MTTYKVVKGLVGDKLNHFDIVHKYCMSVKETKMDRWNCSNNRVMR